MNKHLLIKNAAVQAEAILLADQEHTAVVSKGIMAGINKAIDGLPEAPTGDARQALVNELIPRVRIYFKADPLLDIQIPCDKCLGMKVEQEDGTFVCKCEKPA